MLRKTMIGGLCHDELKNCLEKNGYSVREISKYPAYKDEDENWREILRLERKLDSLYEGNLYPACYVMTDATEPVVRETYRELCRNRIESLKNPAFDGKCGTSERNGEFVPESIYGFEEPTENEEHLINWDVKLREGNSVIEERIPASIR